MKTDAAVEPPSSESEHTQELTPPAPYPGGESVAQQPVAPSAPGKRSLTGTLQRKANGARGVAADATLPVDPGTGGVGSPLPTSLESRFSSGLGADLSGVRVHTDEAAASAAESVSARAFTRGNDIYFGRGAWDPGSTEGQHLIAHEVAHTVQQSGAPPATQTKLEVSMPGDSLEVEADRAADALVAGAAAPPLSRGGAGTLSRKTQEQSFYSSSSSHTRNDLVGITAQVWLTMHAANLIAHVGHQLADAPLALTTPFVSWKNGSSREFAIEFWSPFWSGQADAWNMLSKAITPDRLDKAIDSGRDCWPFDKGPIEFKDAVIGEVRRVIFKRLTESLPRVLPRYLAAKNQLALRAESGDKSFERDPDRDEVAASHPIDHWVIKGLKGQLAFNLAGYRASNPGEGLKHEIKKARPITFEWQHDTGAWNWIRVTSPPDPTKEEVAVALCGSDTMADTITGAAPLFGFHRVEDLTEANRKAYYEKSRTAKVGPSHQDAHFDRSPDQQALAGPLGDEVAQNQAKTIKPSDVKANPDGALAVIERMRLCVTAIERMMAVVKDAPVGSQARQLDQTLKRLQDRSHKLNQPGIDPAEVIKWDAQSQGQLELINAAHSGVVMAMAQRDAFKSWPSSINVIQHLSGCYLEVAAFSDLYESGKEKLTYANEQSQQFPVTLMEFVLAEIRKVLHSARDDKTKLGAKDNTTHYDVTAMEQREQKLREGLIKVRELLLQNPEAAKTELQRLQKELADLQLGTSIVHDMDTMDAVWRALYDSLSVVGVITGSNSDASDAMTTVNRMNSEWHDIFLKWKYGEKEEARKALEAKRPTWEKEFGRIQTMIKDNATRDKWVTFGILVGIAIITAGIGVYVEAAAGAVWGAASWATFGVTVGSEAIAFTSMSYLIVEKDPSISGFFLELGKNVLLFGALRGVGGAYTRMVGEEAAATALGKGGQLLTQFVALNVAALTEAQIKKKLETGQNLTEAEIAEISKQNLLFLAAVAIGMRAVKPGIESLKIQGTVDGTFIRIRGLRSEIKTLTTEIEAQKGADFSKGKELLLKEQELLKLEEEALVKLEKIAADPKKAKAAGLDSKSAQDSLVALRAEHDAMVKAAKPTEILASMETVGPDVQMVAHDKFMKAVDHFKSQSDLYTVRDLVADAETGARAIEVTPKDGKSFRVVERMSKGEGVVGQSPETMRRAPSAAEVEANRARAEEARRLFAERNQKTKEMVDAREPAEFERIQIGAEVAALINQATLPKAAGGGAASKPGGADAVAWPRMLTVAEKGEVWIDRGPVNQTPGELEAPGLHPSQMTTNQHGYIDAKPLADAIMLGKFEQGMQVYEGRVQGPVELKAGQADWTSSKNARVKVVTADGKVKYLYADHIDLAVGPGPSATVPETAVAGGTKGDGYKELLADKRLFYGDQAPTHVVPGAKKVVVWGGSGNGAAMAEHFAKAGADVTWVGRESTPEAGSKEAIELKAIEADLKDPSLSDTKRIELLDRRRDLKAFRRAMLPRNVEEAFDSPLAKEKIHREIGSIENIRPIEVDGVKKVALELNGKTVVVDQIVISLGQNPDATGAAGHLIGKAQLKMVLSSEGRLVALETTDGTIRLLGAAAMEPKLARHVIAAERDAFLQKVAEQAATLPDNSRGVAPSIANARFTVTAANEALAADLYKLPGNNTSIDLVKGDEANWPLKVAEFLAGELGVDKARIGVTPIKDGMSNDPVYRITLGAEELGIYKVFRTVADAAVELNMLKLVADKKLKLYKAVEGKGEMSVKGEPGEPRGAILMETAEGASVDSMVKNLSVEPTARAEGLAKIRQAAIQVAKAMAEFHKAFATGEAMTDPNKRSETSYIVNVKLEAVRAKIGEANYRAIKAALEGDVIPKFLASRVPATAAHGDANIGNFVIAPDGTVRVIDMSTMKYSLDGANKGKGTGAADVARFLESLKSKREGALAPHEVAEIEAAFNTTYFSEMKGVVTEADYAAATQLYRVDLELGGIRAGLEPAGPVNRMHQTLGLPDPVGFPKTGAAPLPRSDDEDKKRTGTGSR